MDQAHGFQEDHALLPGDGQQLPELPGGDHRGLFAQDMLPGQKHLPGLVIVAAGGAGNVYGVHLGAGRQILQPVEDQGQAVGLGKFPAGLQPPGVNGHRPKRRNRFRRRQHPVHHEIPADDTKTNHMYSSLMIE